MTITWASMCCLYLEVLESYSFLILGSSTRGVFEQSLFNSYLWAHPLGYPLNYHCPPHTGVRMDTKGSYTCSGNTPNTRDENAESQPPWIPDRLWAPHQSWRWAMARLRSQLSRTSPSASACLYHFSSTSFQPWLAHLKESMVRMEIYSKFKSSPNRKQKEATQCWPIAVPLVKTKPPCLLFQDNKIWRVIWSLNVVFGLR